MPELTEAKEDGDVMNVLKKYFAGLEQPATSAPGTRPVQRFTYVLLCAYKEFQGVTSDLVADLRRSHQYRVVQARDIYSKRSHLHDLKDVGRFSKQQVRGNTPRSSFLMRFFDTACLRYSFPAFVIRKFSMSCVLVDYVFTADSLHQVL